MRSDINEHYALFLQMTCYIVPSLSTFKMIAFPKMVAREVNSVTSGKGTGVKKFEQANLHNIKEVYSL